MYISIVPFIHSFFGQDSQDYCCTTWTSRTLLQKLSNESSCKKKNGWVYSYPLSQLHMSTRLGPTTHHFWCEGRTFTPKKPEKNRHVQCGPLGTFHVNRLKIFSRLGTGLYAEEPAAMLENFLGARKGAVCDGWEGWVGGDGEFMDVGTRND